MFIFAVSAVIGELKRKFKDYSEEMVKIALESSSYKPERAETILNTMLQARQKR